MGFGMPRGYPSDSGVVEFRLETPRSTDSSSTPYTNPSLHGLPSLPGYELLEQIGRGGMGVVYKARQLALNRLVAIKLLPNAEKAGQTTIARFFAEAQSVADVHHPNVVEVYDFGEVTVRNSVNADDTAEYVKVPYLVMELLDGGHYGDGRHPAKSRDPRQAAAILAKVARGLAAAHKVGIVHRDIKPGNILFTRSGEPKVVDFGLAKRAMSNLTLSVAVMGTPYYMSPEQAKGKSKVVGPPTDVWAIGVILYESLAGCLPFDAENHYSLMHQIITENPDPPRIHNRDLPPELEAIILKCLAKKPEHRYPSAAKLADALEAFHFESGMFVPLNTIVPGSRRRRDYSLPLLLVLLFGIIGTCLWLWQKAEWEKRELHEKTKMMIGKGTE
jgi:eukaryotic-like serine/threonine-protein kinase